jgi:copper chaperone CopZ
MKIVKIIFAVVFLLGTITVSAQDKKKNNKEETVVFSVSMDCHNCEQKIKKNIPYEKGVKDLTTNLEKKLVTITYQTVKTDKAKLKKSIEKLGFTCRELTDEGSKSAQ